jgi:argininosuccinate lyase
MKPWDGRFSEKTKEIVDNFNASINFDKRLYKEDIQGSIAHCKMLAKQKIISDEDKEKIINGLNKILNEIDSGEFKFKEELEDIHMNIESRLIELIGETGGKLHTARSRNDQVNVDIRLYIRKETEEILSIILELLKNFNKKAMEYIDNYMPGFTHLQQAQPILISHYLLAYFEMFKRDYFRFKDFFNRLNECPLGAGALAGTTFPIDRFFTAKLLGFEKPTNNSIDTVADRDFIIEFISNASIVMMHLSRFSEEMVIFSSSQFKFVELSDGFCTGSSIMPQKKNPDIPELIRGKTGRIYGNLISILTVMKGLTLAYNKDLQEDKEPLFDTVDTLKNSLLITIDMLNETKFLTENTYLWSKKDFITATEIADYLANKGIPFREAHKITGQIVKFCIDNHKDLYELTISDFKKFSDLFDEDIFNAIKVETSVNRRISFGGTAKTCVEEQISSNNIFLNNERSNNGKKD